MYVLYLFWKRKLENDEKWKIHCLHILILKLHISLSTLCYNMGAFDFWPLPIFWHVYVGIGLLKMHMLLAFENEFVQLVLKCAIDFLIMQFILKCSFDKKVNLCIFKFVHSYLSIKNHPFLWTGRNPVICKKGKNWFQPFAFNDEH